MSVKFDNDNFVDRDTGNCFRNYRFILSSVPIPKNVTKN